ncbi:hypothetical protein QBC46DRAFT_428586, partial [Diplogelasinospora grovesii]
LLTLLLPCLSAAQSPFPATVEVDVIFPQNDTYAPSPLMPIVFAIQNAHLAGPLDVNFEWSVYLVDDPDGVSDQRTVDLRGANLSNTSLYFAYQTTGKLNHTEGAWSLLWTVSSGNCSGSGSNRTWAFSGSNLSKNLYFSTNNSAPAPDLVAATADNTCANMQAYTFNVTGILDVPDPSKYDGHSSCAVVAPGPTPAANPCGAKVDAAAASSISAAIMSSACAAPQPVVSCPP